MFSKIRSIILQRLEAKRDAEAHRVTQLRWDKINLERQIQQVMMSTAKQQGQDD